jgi:hypothetical protein
MKGISPKGQDEVDLLVSISLTPWGKYLYQLL